MEEGDRGEGDRGQELRRIGGRRQEKRGPEAGFPRWWQPRETERNCATLHNIWQTEIAQRGGNQ